MDQVDAIEEAVLPSLGALLTSRYQRRPADAEDGLYDSRSVLKHEYLNDEGA